MPSKRETRLPEYELVFSATGAVELISLHYSGGRASRSTVWTSDGDEDFADEFEGDFFGDEDTEEILEYLNEAGVIDDPDLLSIDVIEKAVSDDGEEMDVDDLEAIDGEFIERQ